MINCMFEAHNLNIQIDSCVLVNTDSTYVKHGGEPELFSVAEATRWAILDGIGRHGVRLVFVAGLSQWQWR